VTTPNLIPEFLFSLLLIHTSLPSRHFRSHVNKDGEVSGNFSCEELLTKPEMFSVEMTQLCIFDKCFLEYYLS
jgi:hypothetical protein